MGLPVRAASFPMFWRAWGGRVWDAQHSCVRKTKRMTPGGKRCVADGYQIHAWIIEQQKHVGKFLPVALAASGASSNVLP